MRSIGKPGRLLKRVRVTDGAGRSGTALLISAEIVLPGIRNQSAIMALIQMPRTAQVVTLPKCRRRDVLDPRVCCPYRQAALRWSNGKWILLNSLRESARACVIARLKPLTGSQLNSKPRQLHPVQRRQAGLRRFS